MMQLLYYLPMMSEKKNAEAAYQSLVNTVFYWIQ